MSGLNTYGYAFQNPTKFIDQDGQLAFLAAPVVFGGGSAAAGGSSFAGAAAFFGSAGLAGYYLNEIFNDSVPDDPTDNSTEEPEQCDVNEKDPCKGLKKQLRKHEKKYQDYLNDPYGNDNKGFLANSPSDRHSQIIDGRLRNLLRQIESWKKLVAECERKNGKR